MAGERINPWLIQQGVFLPNWLLLRTELSLEAKVVLGMIGEQDDPTRATNFDALATRLGTTCEKIRLCVEELRKHNLVAYDVGPEDVVSLRVCAHPWMRATFIIDEFGNHHYTNQLDGDDFWKAYAVVKMEGSIEEEDTDEGEDEDESEAVVAGGAR